MTGPTRIWTETGTLPATPPAAFSKAYDVVFTTDGAAYQWINAKWTRVYPVWLPKPQDTLAL